MTGQPLRRVPSRRMYALSEQIAESAPQGLSDLVYDWLELDELVDEIAWLSRRSIDLEIEAGADVVTVEDLVHFLAAQPALFKAA